MLISLAKDHTDEAAKQLGGLHVARNNAEQQLTMLNDYRADYLLRLQNAMMTGMSAADCHNYQRFIATLDDAIDQQRAVLEQAATHLEQGKERWREERRKLNSLDALAQRQQQVVAREDARREQRLNDEYSARLVRQGAGLH
ncbi:flagellar export protein FliJ [Bordetella bronchialis]